jgi:uncharacterized protein (TIGR03083 family)
MPDAAAVYRETRERLSAYVDGEIDEERVKSAVPACPGWTVQDVVSHMVGIVADIQDGRMDGVGSDEWTNHQVATRRGLPIAEVVAEWARRAPAFEEQITAWPPGVASQVAADAAMHELDVRNALGDRSARDTDGVAIAFDYYGHKLADRITEAGLGALVVECEAGAVRLGDTDPGATLRATRFEALRAMGGRRSAAQIAAADCDGDATPYVALMSSYASRAEPLVE